MQSTNTVQVKIPQGLGFQQAVDALKRFGEVSHVTVTDVATLALSVVFFDVRAADKARKALGETCCKVAPQTGIRTVCLPAGAQLGVDSIRGISNVKPDATDEKSMVLEFFDTRDAQRVQDLVDKQTSKSVPTLTAPPGLAPPGLAPPGLSPPTYSEQREKADAKAVLDGLIDICCPNGPVGVAAPPGLEPPPGLSLPKKDMTPEPPSECPPAPPSINAPSADAVEVLIKNLPEKLCSDAALLAIFEQGEIERYVLSYQVRRDSAMGEAHLWLKNRKAGKKCVKHFDGLPWDPEGSRVEAKLLTPAPEKAEKPEKQHKTKVSQRTQSTKSQWQAPTKAQWQAPHASKQAQWQAPQASKQAIDQQNLQEAMAHFFSSPTGQKLLSAESTQGIVAKPLPPGPVANIDWDDFSDLSEGEH